MADTVCRCKLARTLVPASQFAEPSLALPFRYWGFLNIPSRCRIRVFEPKEQPLVVLATELPDNPGTSITNFAVPFATQVGLLLRVVLLRCEVLT